jgi:hypothetical protein
MRNEEGRMWEAGIDGEIASLPLAMTLVIYNSLIMRKKYRKERQLTPAWLDTLIGWLEVLAAIGAVVGAIYALVSLFKMFGS